MSARKYDLVSELMKFQTNKLLLKRANEWTNEWKDEVNEWMVGKMNENEQTNVWMSE